MVSFFSPYRTTRIGYTHIWWVQFYYFSLFIHRFEIFVLFFFFIYYFILFFRSGCCDNIIISFYWPFSLRILNFGNQYFTSNNFMFRVRKKFLSFFFCLFVLLGFCTWKWRKTNKKININESNSNRNEYEK